MKIPEPHPAAVLATWLALLAFIGWWVSSAH